MVSVEKDTSSEDNGKKQKSLTQLVDEYKLTEQLQILYIPQDSKLAGMTMSKLDLNNVYGLTILREGRKAASTTSSSKTSIRIR